MRKSLVALDTDHIKDYVFGTDTLQEIRGASSILDRLNRREMVHIAEKEFGAQTIYANGGSGLFVIDGGYERADKLGKAVQSTYRRETRGGSSITYVVQELPDDAGEDILNRYLADELELLGYQLREKKDSAPVTIAVPSHAFMHPCEACGIRYAEGRDEGADNRDAVYCMSCLEKRHEDARVKTAIPGLIRRMDKKDTMPEEYLWGRILRSLKDVGYVVPENTQRPNDFNDFSQFGGRGYLGLIYADGNSMGQQVEEQKTLLERRRFAKRVDDAIHIAMSLAAKQHLPVWKGKKKDENLFPFDILLLGGDDVTMVVPASVAMDVAYTIAEQFHLLTDKKQTLSVGVLLAPVKYPFGLLLDLVEGTLKAAKKGGTKAQKTGESLDTTRINFATVMGTTNHEFGKVYAALHAKREMQRREVEFYATLRPYDLKQLAFLLSAIREGHKKGLGRTKLHRLREAILKMNLTTSVVDALSVLRNWKQTQREFIVDYVYAMGRQYQLPQRDPNDPATWAFRNPFPWFADGKDTYRTSLLDFVELYDFVRREGDAGDDEN